MFRKNYGLLPFIREDVHSDSLEQNESYGWELTKFNVPSKWLSSQGENIKVAVIDTGCDLNHKDLKNNLLEGKNFVEPNTDPMDRNGHGSHVAGTIAASKNGIGITGVAPKSKIVPVKALGDNGQGNIKHIISAIEWSANIGVDFITMSLGSPNKSKQLENVIKYAHDKGCVIFCAAGNSGQDVDIMYPAKYDYTISIGAIDRNLERTNFTCSGDTLDFLAPGHEILGCVPGDQYAIMSGTSMSNPFAVGCACLALSLYKKENRSNMLKTYNDYINLFQQNAIHLKNPQYSNIRKYEGFGIINPI
jgi:subtilisin family serine protease